MGAAQTTVGHGWKQPSEAKLERWRRIQRGSCMIQRLSLDVDAQYHCYQPYLLLTDIIHLYRTCRIWCHWIRSPGSVAHHSSHSRQRRGAGMVTVRHPDELQAIAHHRWIQEYVYGCLISSPIGYRSDKSSWVKETPSPSRFKFRSKSSTKSPTPLLKQLAELKQIQHLTFDHVYPNELSSEGIQAYFAAVAPCLRSLDLFPEVWTMDRERLYGHLNSDTYVYRCLQEIHQLTHLEELRFTITQMHEREFWQQTDWPEQLLKFPHFHTFHLTNSNPYVEPRPCQALQKLARCQQLKHCSWGQYAFGMDASNAGVKDMKEFILERVKSRKTDLSSAAAAMIDSGGGETQVDPMEFLELSTIRLDTDLWTMVVANFPNLTTLSGDWRLSPNDWSSLTSFKQLTDLQIVNGKSGIEVNHLVPHLIQVKPFKV